MTFFVLCSIWSCFPGAWQGAKEFEFKVWHSNIEKYVYQESPWISKYIDTIINSNPNLQNGFMCAHVRRGNFKKACRLYDEEMQSGYLYYLFLHRILCGCGIIRFLIFLLQWSGWITASPRTWVKQFAERELVCYVNDKIFIDQITAVMQAW